MVLGAIEYRWSSYIVPSEYTEYIAQVNWYFHCFQENYGCSEQNISLQYNSTSDLTAFSQAIWGLHPYRSYTVNITAFTLYVGPANSDSFTTTEESKFITTVLILCHQLYLRSKFLFYKSIYTKLTETITLNTWLKPPIP